MGKPKSHKGHPSQRSADFLRQKIMETQLNWQRTQVLLLLFLFLRAKKEPPPPLPPPPRTTTTAAATMHPGSWMCCQSEACETSQLDWCDIGIALRSFHIAIEIMPHL